MALSSLRSRRFSGQSVEILEKYVAFRLRAAWFVLPITAIYRVLPLADKKVPKVEFMGKSVLLIDVGKLLFGKDPIKPAAPLILNGSPVANQPSLIIISDRNGIMISIPSNSQPALLRLSQSQFLPLPPTLAHRWQVDFISGMTKPIEERPDLFAIDPNQLKAISIPN